ncbi:DUF5665 domain-containing protein [Desulfitibacter alkalitolerans]|uniref:DUF5665 domain-containing protein n=1 Tax=Desulfitibacter alkalitolerans TaxID=264641 RepID=UPI0004833112|nr:DUF5665 domain-containing protein [Desulfitibacter alkalitolerans]
MEKKDNKSLEEKLSNLAYMLEKAQIREYVSLLEDPKRLIYMNFLAGVARGLGMAVGFTLLGALALYLLQKVVLLNLPLISDFIADIVRMVREQSY